MPSTIFISHNHSDHAGELPVVLAVEGLQKKRKMQVVGEPEVLERLRSHRMHELVSLGLQMEDFASWVSAPEEEPVEVETDVGRLLVTTFMARHSERCFGARLEIGRGQR